MAKKKADATNANGLERSFSFNGLTLPDPDDGMTTDQVRDFYAGTYPELNNAGIKGPVEQNNQAVYTFNIQTGTKG
jgi:PRTRC genetic system protein C